MNLHIKWHSENRVSIDALRNTHIKYVVPGTNILYKPRLTVTSESKSNESR